jgi:hypothetical protein
MQYNENNMKTSVISFRAPAETKALVEAMAQAQSRSVSNFLDVLIRDHARAAGLLPPAKPLKALSASSSVERVIPVPEPTPVERVERVPPAMSVKPLKQSPPTKASKSVKVTVTPEKAPKDD